MRNTLFSLSLLPAGLLSFLLASSTVVTAKYGGVTMDLDGTLHCPTDTSKSSFCAGDSNSTDFIIHCREGEGTISACSLDLVAIEPVGVKYGASCFEESKTSGKALCIYDGKDYDTYDYKSQEPVKLATETVANHVPASAPTPSEEDVAQYIMEGIRQHGSN